MFSKHLKCVPCSIKTQVTGCEEFPVGNLVNWEETNWFLNSSKGTARDD